MFSYALTNHRFRLKPAVLFRPGRALLAKFLHYSGPVVLNETLWGLGTSLYKVIMGHMEGSTEILAARAWRATLRISVPCPSSPSATPPPSSWAGRSARAGGSTSTRWEPPWTPWPSSAA